MDVTLYKTPTCPKCRVLKMKLEEKGVTFNTCEDIEVLKAKGISSVPVLEVDGKMMTFVEANNWVNDL